MKTLFFFFLLSPLAAHAAFVACTPVTSAAIVSGGVATAASFVCAPNLLANNVAGDGLGVQAIELVMRVSVETIGGAPGVFQSVQATMTNNASFNNPGTLTVSGVTSLFGGLSATQTCPVTTTAVACVDVVPAFTVTVAALPGGSLPNSAVAEVFYEALNCPPSTAMPEPSSLALMGAAALVLARRAFKLPAVRP